MCICIKTIYRNQFFSIKNRPRYKYFTKDGFFKTRSNPPRIGDIDYFTTILKEGTKLITSVSISTKRL